MPEGVRAHFWITGRVQGVCFRAEAEQQATGLKLTGWVRNTEDGKVEVLCEGPREKVQSMIDWCHQGPPTARVSRVDVEWEPYRGNIPDFRIVMTQGKIPLSP